MSEPTLRMVKLLEWRPRADGSVHTVWRTVNGARAHFVLAAGEGHEHALANIRRHLETQPRRP